MGRAVAVLGDGASLTEVAGLAELAEEEVARTADVLVALAILRPGEGLEFAHPIVREAVYTNIGPRERGKARAAGILAADDRATPGRRSHPGDRPGVRTGTGPVDGDQAGRGPATTDDPHDI